MLKKLRLNRIFLFILLLILFLGVEGFLLKSYLNFDPEVSTVVFVNDYEKGTLITNKMIKLKKFKLNNLPKDAVKDENEIVGQYILQDVFSGQYVVKKVLASVDPNKAVYDKEDGKSFVSIKFDKADSANSWILEKNEIVRIVFSPYQRDVLSNDAINEFTKSKIITAKIIEIKDDALHTINDKNFNKNKPMFITFEVDERDAIFIINAKDKGRLEIFCN